MNEKFKFAFDNLTIDEKRNQISNELMIIGELINKIEKNYGVDNMLNIKNYDVVKDNDLTETEMLSYIYEDIYRIQKELITVLNIIAIKKEQ